MRKTNHNVQRAVPPSHNNNMKWQLEDSDFEESEEGDDSSDDDFDGYVDDREMLE